MPNICLTTPAQKYSTPPVLTHPARGKATKSLNRFTKQMRAFGHSQKKASVFEARAKTRPSPPSRSPRPCGNQSLVNRCEPNSLHVHRSHTHACAAAVAVSINRLRCSHTHTHTSYINRQPPHATAGTNASIVRVAAARAHRSHPRGGGIHMT